MRTVIINLGWTIHNRLHRRLNRFYWWLISNTESQYTSPNSIPDTYVSRASTDPVGERIRREKEIRKILDSALSEGDKAKAIQNLGN